MASTLPAARWHVCNSYLYRPCCWGLPAQHPPDGWWRSHNTFPAATVQAASWSRGCLAQWLVRSGTCPTQLVHCRAVCTLLLEPQPVPLLGRRQNHKPLIHVTLDTAVSYSHLHTSKIALKFAIENPNFTRIFSAKTGFSLLGRGQKSSEELKLSRTRQCTAKISPSVSRRDSQSMNMPHLFWECFTRWGWGVGRHYVFSLLSPQHRPCSLSIAKAHIFVMQIKQSS